MNKVFEMEEKVELFGEGKKTSIVAGLTTLFFALAKGFVGMISGSVVLVGDAVHSAADSFSAFLVWAGLKISQKDPTEKFPYGFYKVENITSLIVSGLIIFAGYSIFKESFSKLFVLTELSYPLIAFGTAIADALVMYSVGKYEIREGEKINSKSLIADGKESKLHIFSSSIVLIGLFAGFYGISYLEGLAGIAISLLIFKEGVESAKDSIFALIDASPSEKIEKKVIKTIGKVSGIEGYGELKLRKSGPFVFGECAVKIRKFLDVDRAHEITEKLQRKIKEEVKNIDSFIVHLEPIKLSRERIAVPIKSRDGNSEISDHFGRAEYFAFLSIDKEKKEWEVEEIKENKFKEKEIRAGLSASQLIAREKIDVVITKEMGEISFHSLRDQLVDIYKEEGKKLNEIVENYISEKLEKLKKPTREKN